MWLVYLKVMYDAYGWAKVVIWLCIIYLVGRVLYEMFGWLGIAIPIFIIIGLIVYFLIIEPRLERRRYEEMSKTNPAVVKKHKKVLKQYLPKKEHKENPVPKFKKRLSNEEAELAYQKAIMKNPDAVSDITMQGDDKIYRLYWLSKEEPDNDLFDVSFTIRKDCQSMDVTITNTSDKSIDVDWKQFKIDRRSSLLNGLSWIDFKGNGKIEPGESSTVSVQPSIYNEGSPIPMFDLDKIKQEEIIFKASFHVKSPTTSKYCYNCTIHTKMKMIF